MSRSGAEFSVQDLSSPSKKRRGNLVETKWILWTSVGSKGGVVGTPLLCLRGSVFPSVFYYTDVRCGYHWFPVPVVIFSTTGLEPVCHLNTNDRESGRNIDSWETLCDIDKVGVLCLETYLRVR